MAQSSPRRASSDSLTAAGRFPQVFGKYVLLRPLARGGMGELFLAVAGETEGFEKLCVVKKVVGGLQDAGVRRRFLDEAKVVVQLNHGNLVQVFDAGRVRDEHYLAMELVEGKDLRAVWNRCAQLHRRIPVDLAIYTIRELARGLAYAHEFRQLDLVHRDVSPPNILVGYHGQVKLTDFGLAKSTIKREVTTPGVVFGRYSYLSPEQAKGIAADHRTDIYSAGVVLWELLTGRQLFPTANRNHKEALAAVRNPEVRPPSSIVPGIPEGLDRVVLKSLAGDREERYSTAEEFRAGLSDVLSKHFPQCDADRVSGFMRDIFARERKEESEEYSESAKGDYSSLRSAAHSQADLESITDDNIDATGGNADSSAIQLRDSDIHELDRPGHGGLRAKMNPKQLRASAEGWIGKVVAKRYRVESLIGIGGMGAVFRVTHIALGKTFAFKVLHAVYTRDADILTRFMREARVGTQTGHPNIIDVIDVGTTDDGDVYFVMELLDGQDLGRLVRADGPLAIRRAVHIVRQICRALAAAHEAGIIHRDLKSENIFLTPRPNDPDFVKVLDFGICKTIDADSRQTSPGLVMGSPDYMAPEQGAGVEASVKSDIYAVGCILFETLAGRLPYTGRNAIDVLMKKSAREADPVEKYRSDVPGPISELVAKCLRRDPTERPENMRVLEYELTRAMEGRANAVASVLGLAESLESVAADSSTSMPVVARGGGDVATADTTQVVTNPPEEEETRVYDSNADASFHMDPGQSGSHASASMSQAQVQVVSGAKALLFTALGGALALGLLYGVRPDLFDGGGGDDLDRSAAVEPSTTPGEGGEGEGRAANAAALPAGTTAAAVAEPAAAEPSIATGSGGVDEPAGDATAADGATAGTGVADAAETEGTGGPGDGEADSRTETSDLIARAEAALRDGKLREPEGDNLALYLTRLASRDPSHEAVGRLRSVAAESALPTGRDLVRAKEWDQAAKTLRGLVAVWPQNAEARELLAKALRSGYVDARKAREYERALAMVDELLNLEPADFDALMKRGHTLAKLKRWDEAAAAYKSAKVARPKSRSARKLFVKATREARKAARAAGR